MPKLHQIIAVERDARRSGETAFTGLYHGLQKAELLSGISRSYRPKDDEGDQLPAESVRVVVTVEQVLAEARTALGRMYDVVATKEWANAKAAADVVVDGQVLLAQVPVCYLLWLERKLVDLATFVRKLPVLDPAQAWHADDTTDVGVFKTDPVETVRTKRVTRNHVLAEATKEHRAQVQPYQEDVIVGWWTTVRFSGAAPAKRVAELVGRVERLAEAVKFAREEANRIEAEPQQAAAALFGYLFAPAGA